MKRSPIKRRTPLARSTTPLKRSPIRKRSKKMEATYAKKDGRRAFVAQLLGGVCEVQWENCTGMAQDVHEWWARGMGGAIVPGDKADRQGQRFITVCRRCHGELDEQPKRAREEGWVR